MWNNMWLHEEKSFSLDCCEEANHPDKTPFTLCHNTFNDRKIISFLFQPQEMKMKCQPLVTQVLNMSTVKRRTSYIKIPLRDKK